MPVRQENDARKGGRKSSGSGRKSAPPCAEASKALQGEIITESAPDDLRLLRSMVLAFLLAALAAMQARVDYATLPPTTARREKLAQFSAEANAAWSRMFAVIREAPDAATTVEAAGRHETTDVIIDVQWRQNDV